jgi:hypothetical protein
MGQVADDAFDAAIRSGEIDEQMKFAGARRCNHRLRATEGDECPTCLDLGWIDKDGNPCEP